MRRNKTTSIGITKLKKFVSKSKKHKLRVHLSIDRQTNRLDSSPYPPTFLISSSMILATIIRYTMEASDLLPLLDQLDYNVDDLEEVLGPIVNQSLTQTSKKLPVLEKAKLNVLTTYALESLIYCKIFLTTYSGYGY